MKNRKSRTEKFLNYAIIFIASILAFFPVLSNGFTNYDDGRYILNNPLIQELSLSGIIGYFISFFDGHYHPLTMISLAIDHSIGGLDPFQFHLTNLILHVFNALLVYAFITKIAKDRMVGLFTALLFTVSPLAVESVSWLSERKNLLFSFFFLWSLNQYISYIDKQKRSHYLYSLLLFILACLSKSQAIALVLVLPLIDYLRKENFSGKKQLIQKVPFLLIAIAFAIVSGLAQHAFWGESELLQKDPSLRLVFGFVAFMMYSIRTFIPFNIAAIHPYPADNLSGIPFYYYFALLFTAVFIYLLVKAYHREKREYVFGLLFFGVNIFMLLKFLNMPYGDYYMADRYSYIAGIGLFYIATVGFKQFSQKYHEYRRFIYIVPVLYLIGMLLQSNIRTTDWKDSISLWSRVIDVYPEAVQGWNDRGNAKSQSGDARKAIKDFDQAIRIDPNNAICYNNRGSAKAKVGEYIQAIADFDRALQLKHDYADAYVNRGNALLRIREFDLALKDLNNAIKLRPEYTLAYNTRGSIYLRQENFEAALADFNQAINLNTNFGQAYANRGITFNKLYRHKEALQDLNTAYSLGIKNHLFHFERGFAKFHIGDYTGCITDLDRAIVLHGNNMEYFFYRGYAYYMLEDYFKAVDDISFFITANPDVPYPYYLRGRSLVMLKSNKEIACEDLLYAGRQGVEEARELYEINCQ